MKIYFNKSECMHELKSTSSFMSSKRKVISIYDWPLICISLAES